MDKSALSAASINKGDNQVPVEIAKQLERWKFHSRVLRISHFILTFIATVCTVLVAARLTPSPLIPIEWLAVIASVSVSLLSAYNLGSKSNKMRAAWRKLNAAKIIYEENPKALLDQKDPLYVFTNIYYEAEGIIGDVKE